MEGAGNTSLQKNLTSEGSKFIINLESLTGQEDNPSYINISCHGSPAFFRQQDIFSRFCCRNSKT